MSMYHPSNRLAAGAMIASREITTVSGDSIRIPDGEHLIHLQFRRFAG